jgi:hypothetical protein
VVLHVGLGLFLVCRVRVLVGLGVLVCLVVVSVVFGEVL